MDEHPNGALTFMLLYLVGHVADLHFTPMCAMLLKRRHAQSRATTL